MVNSKLIDDIKIIVYSNLLVYLGSLERTMV